MRRDHRRVLCVASASILWPVDGPGLTFYAVGRNVARMWDEFFAMFGRTVGSFGPHRRRLDSRERHGRLRREEPETRPSDAEALAGDWARVGQDLRRAFDHDEAERDDR
ncbi:MAG: hypothetical protein R3B09_27830 [Nannocystaceae bacterium]